MSYNALSRAADACRRVARVLMNPVLFVASKPPAMSMLTRSWLYRLCGELRPRHMMFAYKFSGVRREYLPSQILIKPNLCKSIPCGDGRQPIQ